METHAHDLHNVPGHGWKHYFFEFFMLFLAVFCGFLAENIREHQVEMRREREFITSLVSDLKDDTLSIKKQIDYIEKGIVLFDSLSMLLESPELARKNTETIYYNSRMGIRLAPLVNNSRTVEQLKNSGGFTLIRNQETSNRIMKYYSGFPELHMLENIFDGENIAFKNVASKVMNQAVYRKQINPDGSVARISGNLSLLTYDEATLNQLGFYAVQMNGSREGMIPLLQKLKLSAEELSEYLQKTYQLE